MKKIMCYIDMLGRGGAQRVMSNLVTYFSERGYEVVLVNNYKRDDNLPNYVVPDNVKRIYLRPKRQGNPIIKNLVRIVRLRRAIKAEKPDVILSFLGEPNLVMLVSSFGIKCRKVLSVRNDPNKEYGTSKIKKRLVDKLFCTADGVVFQTEDASLYFSQNVRDKAKIIYNLVSNEMYTDEVLPDRKHIMTLGRLQPQKNHVMLIDAFKMVADKYPDENLYIYGDGPLRNETEEYINKLGLSDRVFLPGNIANVKEALMNAKLFVMSSDYEGLPNALMEAMATGTPAISTNCPCGGPKTLIENSSQGLLVDVGDTDALIVAMDTLLGNDDVRKNIGIEARKRAEVFRDSIIFKQWEEYLESVAKKSL